MMLGWNRNELSGMEKTTGWPYLYIHAIASTMAHNAEITRPRGGFHKTHTRVGHEGSVVMSTCEGGLVGVSHLAGFRGYKILWRIRLKFNLMLNRPISDAETSRSTT